MKIFPYIIYAIVLSCTLASSSLAQSHKGEVDSDGILSPGELRNPLIDYSRRGHHKVDQDRYRPNYKPDYKQNYKPNYKPNNNWSASYLGWDRQKDDYEYSYDKDRYDGSHFTGALWDGIRSGRISRREEDQLRQEQQDLHRREEQYARDGRISWRERNDLINRRTDLQDKLNHELYDGEKRW